MAQAVELIEETLAAERRKRERQSASALADATSFSRMLKRLNPSHLKLQRRKTAPNDH